MLLKRSRPLIFSRTSHAVHYRVRLLSCCLSSSFVTFVYCDKTTKAKITRFSLKCNSKPHIFCGKSRRRYSTESRWSELKLWSASMPWSDCSGVPSRHVRASLNHHQCRYLHSAARGDLQVLATKTVTFGPRSFASSAPKLWNSLPQPLRDSTLTLRQFSSRLKTHLFSLAYMDAPRDCLGCKGCAI